ncbi:MAG TPA: hypothetical protein VFP56_03445 [Candidatus Limnocylindrales bacterium]|nr:hypothetical protein [Candidatus Limnocylindrales bacterium]
MRIYEGSARQDWEEVLRSIGAYVDEHGMRGLVILETDTGLIVQGTSVSTAAGSAWGESMGQARRETLMLDDEQIGAFIDEGLARRGEGPDPSPTHYEAQLRVIGRYLDEKKPRDVCLFELDGAYIARLTQSGQTGLRQEVVEFTPGDIADLIAQAPALRRSETQAKPA